MHYVLCFANTALFSLVKKDQIFLVDQLILLDLHSTKELLAGEATY